jgi:hypothetical protein
VTGFSFYPALCHFDKSVIPSEVERPCVLWKSDLMTNQNGEAFYAGALIRISRFMLVLALAASAGAWWRYGWRSALGLACGSTVAYLNFHWLKRVVAALADRATEAGQEKQSSSGVVLRFLLRYVLMGAGAYAIFTVSPASLYGLLTGLFLPVAGIACEAAYEMWFALAKSASGY